jgi:signal transduction histidine kinase/ActR/RegA family two-component response regulator
VKWLLLRQKLLLLVIFTSVLIALSLSGLLIARQYLLHIDLEQHHLRAQADLLALSTAAALDFDDRKAAGETLSALGAIPEIKLARIFDRKKELFADYISGNFDGNVLSEIDPFSSAEQRIGQYLVLSGKPILSVNTPDTQLGSLEIAYDIAPVMHRAYASAGLSLLLAAGITLLSLLGALRLNRIIARPLFELNSAARNVSQTKDYSIRAVKVSNDELGQLTDVVNEMFQEVEKAERERELLIESERIARTDAEQASRLKDEFLATLSHELRTPLTAISGWAHLLRRIVSESETGGTAAAVAPAALAPEKVKDLEKGLAVIERNAYAQKKLIGDLLEMSRIVTGKIRLDIQEVELPVVIERALETAQPAAQAKEIRLQKIIDPRVTPMHGDPARLQQVIWNLLSNAIKFTPRGGRVQIVLQRINSHVELIVSDTGQGIPPDFLPHIFERFRQADASITREHSGLGIGLSIVKHMVELHGGTVTASSPGLDQGSTFTIKLPLAILHPRPKEDRVHPTAPLRPTQPALVKHEPQSLSGIRVLIIEDEPDARDLIRRVLERAGATVECAGSADEGLDSIATFRPVVLISDIGMPGKDGYTFIREVRARAPEQGGRTPAIALTAFARVEDRTRALVAGYQTHIAKPISPDELIASVASLVGLMR